MPEPVRLIIWDLDETFWRGTVTEGGATYIQAHHDTVIELARRGIMSSICSKNNFETIKQILVDKGLWDYFIFPSINWEPKGPRLAALVDAVQLRTPTILFIDDNAMNRNEALHFLPELQVADETIVSSLLSNPLCVGKDDSGLTRLAQYKLLETKQQKQAACGDNATFLRASNIRVTIEHDLEPHLDRVIELINRTNQLNFTKNRLPENPEKAKEILNALCRNPFIHAGLVHVEDNYGNYGFVGVYFLESNRSISTLKHFCFSCRTLGMNVERWIYDRLGQPEIDIVGEVLTDLFDPDGEVNWINCQDHVATQKSESLSERILVRGGCDMMSAAHYLTLNAEDVVGEFNIVREGLSIRLDLSCFLVQALEGISESALQVAARVGFHASDFTSGLTHGQFDVVIFSFFKDIVTALYRHPSTGLIIPFYEMKGPPNINVLQCEAEYSEQILTMLQRFRDEGFEYIPPAAEMFANNIRTILSFISDNTQVFFILMPETYKKYGENELSLPKFALSNKVIEESARDRPNTHLLHLTDFVENESDRVDWIHFGRMVYFRLYQKIEKILSEYKNTAQPPESLHKAM